MFDNVHYKTDTESKFGNNIYSIMCDRSSGRGGRNAMRRVFWLVVVGQSEKRYFA
jgi:hypothetical protein